MMYETIVNFQAYKKYYIEADSKEDAIDKAKEKICADYKTRNILKIYIKEKEEFIEDTNIYRMENKL